VHLRNEVGRKVAMHLAMAVMNVCCTVESPKKKFGAVPIV
jgi:hypothetical protein